MSELHSGWHLRYPSADEKVDVQEQPTLSLTFSEFQLICTEVVTTAQKLTGEQMKEYLKRLYLLAVQNKQH